MTVLKPLQVLAFFAALCLAPALASAQHPRILLESSEVDGLRSKIEAEPFASMFEQLRNDANWQEETLPNYTEANNAVRNAFLYVLTGEDAYAQAARSDVEVLIGDSEFWAKDVKGLRLYFHGRGVALAYDMTEGAPSWDATFRAQVSAALLDQADFIFEDGGQEQNTNKASNWQGIRWAAAGLCYLATDEDYPSERLDVSYDRVVDYLSENMGTSPESRGWNIEGIGYTGFPWSFVGPFGIGMAKADPARDLRGETEAVGYALWSLYASTLSPPDGTLGETFQGLHPDFGDDNNRTRGEGAFGLSFYYSRASLIPGLKYAYDQLVGPDGIGDWDRHRAGTIYSILYYPDETTAAANPMSIDDWRAGLSDTGGNGYFTFRDRYLDEYDMIAQVYAKLRGNKGHNGPDGLSFRIMGENAFWAVGGGRYGNDDVYFKSQNTLYPSDPDAGVDTSGNSGAIVGTPTHKLNGGGAVTIEVDTSNVGTKNHRRRFFADHSDLTGARATYVISDTSDDGRFFQIATMVKNTIEELDDGFLITAPTGATMKGTIVYGSGDRNLKIGERERGSWFSNWDEQIDSNGYVHFQSDDGDHLVVLTVASAGETHPQVLGSGSGPFQTLTIGELEVTVTEDGITDNGGEGEVIPVDVPDAPDAPDSGGGGTTADDPTGDAPSDDTPPTTPEDGAIGANGNGDSEAASGSTSQKNKGCSIGASNRGHLTTALGWLAFAGLLVLRRRRSQRPRSLTAHQGS